MTSRANYHLEGWGIWRRANRGSVSRGYPSRSAMLATGGGSSDFDHLIDIEDAKAAAICDSIIYDMALSQRKQLEAVYVEMGQKSGRAFEDAVETFWARAKAMLV